MARICTIVSSLKGAMESNSAILGNFMTVPDPAISGDPMLGAGRTRTTARLHHYPLMVATSAITPKHTLREGDDIGAYEFKRDLTMSGQPFCIIGMFPGMRSKFLHTAPSNLRVSLLFLLNNPRRSARPTSRWIRPLFVGRWRHSEVGGCPAGMAPITYICRAALPELNITIEAASPSAFFSHLSYRHGGSLAD